MTNPIKAEKENLKRSVAFIHQLSLHNLWHPHDLNKPIEERRFGEKTLHALEQITQTIRQERDEWIVSELRDIAEIYIGMDGIGGAQTAPEAYQEAKLKEMYDEIQRLITLL